ncbi:hypothetical protein [Pseudobacteroides cellulosolvens]|uniref:Uncharacterized protein n=1 Tax=Pseudobacteroides cellulosolvens ATCC 35603 = DSM 2933 TaxID=398512 RepID=A0A0L6JQP4_9FIRM|nr:hypothetical protein [Pseudobacteroides cellulosolvens]KNY27687.1 hypothetical protein Bccel_2958 [Pseudobacteroides cellulosolvens ATCC 35603 = DSM 2933]
MRCISKKIRKKWFNKIKEMYSTPYRVELDFSPKDKQFLYRLTDGTCFFLKTGKCSLDLNRFDLFKHNLLKKIFRRWYRNADFTKKVHPLYCKNLSTKMYELPKACDVITYYRHSCGHYDFCDGQHRTCIASKLGIKIDVLIDDIDKSCDYCKD